MSLPDSDLSIAVLFAESESLLSLGIFLHSDLNQNVFHALWGIPTCTGHFRCSKPFCILLYMLNRHKFQPGAKLLVNHLVDQSLGLGVKFSHTSSAHYAKLLRDLWTLCYQLLARNKPSSLLHTGVLSHTCTWTSVTKSRSACLLPPRPVFVPA